MTTERAREIIEEISELRAQQAKLLEALPRSMQIQKLWPEAFADNCTCAPVLTGINFPRGGKIPQFLRKYPPPYENLRSVKRTYLRRSDGVEKDITEEEFFSIYGGML